MLTILLIKVVRTQIAVGFPACQDVIGDHQNAMPDRDQGFLLPAPRRQPAVLGTQVRLLAACRAVRGFNQGLPQPGTTFASLATHALAGTLVIARTHPGPRSQMRG